MTRGLTTAPSPAQSNAAHGVGEVEARAARMPCLLVSFGTLADVRHPIGLAVALLCAVVPQKSDLGGRGSVNRTTNKEQERIEEGKKK